MLLGHNREFRGWKWALGAKLCGRRVAFVLVLPVEGAVPAPSSSGVRLSTVDPGLGHF